MSELSETLETYIQGLEKGSLTTRKKNLIGLEALLEQNAAARRIITINSLTDADEATWAYVVKLVLDTLIDMEKGKTTKAQAVRSLKFYDALVTVVTLAEQEGSFLLLILNKLNQKLLSVLKHPIRKMVVGEQASKIVAIILRNEIYLRSADFHTYHSEYFKLFSRALVAIAGSRSRLDSKQLVVYRGASGIGDGFMVNSPFICAKVLTALMGVNSGAGTYVAFLQESVFPFFREYVQASPGDTAPTLELFRGLNSALSRHVMTVLGPFRVFANYVTRHIIKTWSRRKNMLRAELVRFLRITARVNRAMPPEARLRPFDDPKTLQSLLNIVSKEILSVGELYTVHEEMGDGIPAPAQMNKSTYDFIYFACEVVNSVQARLEMEHFQRTREYEMEIELKKGEHTLQTSGFWDEINIRGSTAALQFIYVYILEFPARARWLDLERLSETILRLMRKGSQKSRIWALACGSQLVMLAGGRTKKVLSGFYYG
ncbi:hypothetical protein AAMO2058_000972000 [Amorphochlora amoebiformis]